MDFQSEFSMSKIIRKVLQMSPHTQAGDSWLTQAGLFLWLTQAGDSWLTQAGLFLWLTQACRSINHDLLSQVLR